MGCCQNPNLGADKLRWVSRSEEDESLMLFDFLTLLSLVLVCLLSKSELWCSRKVGQSTRVDDECWIKRIVVITCSQTRFSYLSRTLNSYTWLVAQLQIWMIVFANTCWCNLLMGFLALRISSQFHVFELNWDVCWVSAVNLQMWMLVYDINAWLSNIFLWASNLSSRLQVFGLK